MEIAKPTLKIYNANKYCVEKASADITHEMSVQQHESGCSNMNWLLGHIVYHRDKALKKMGLDTWLGDDYKLLYDYDTPSVKAENAMQFDKLLDQYFSTHDKYLEIIKNTTDIDKMETASFFGFHEAYHAGQMGLLRRILGKPAGF